MITPEKALTHPKRNIITKAMQPHQEQRDEADIHETLDIKKGDCFFLCTDGVLEYLDNENLCSIFNRDISLKEKGEIITEICRDKSKDNFSAYIIAVDDE
jgi:protein phosphatase